MSVSVGPRFEVSCGLNREHMTKTSNGGKVNPAFGSPGVGGAIKFVDNVEMTTGGLNSQVVQINMHGA